MNKIELAGKVTQIEHFNKRSILIHLLNDFGEYIIKASKESNLSVGMNVHIYGKLFSFEGNEEPSHLITAEKISESIDKSLNKIVIDFQLEKQTNICGECNLLLLGNKNCKIYAETDIIHQKFGQNLRVFGQILPLMIDKNQMMKYTILANKIDNIQSLKEKENEQESVWW